MSSADDRRFGVLRAIVADFVATREPIGSKTLVERHNLGVSSATVRNDMAALEEEGYITGYRAEIDRRRIGLGVFAFVRIDAERNNAAATQALEDGIVQVLMGYLRAPALG